MNSYFNRRVLSIVSAGVILAAGAAGAMAKTTADQVSGFDIEILVNGMPLQEYAARGTTYIEAVRESEYSVRLHNRSNRRIAVALAVDGLNSIDASSTSAHRAAKWVLDPHQSITIDGWQTSQQDARRFFFTTEDRSYGWWLGKTENLGVIEAVVFREKVYRQPLTDATSRKLQAPRSAGAAAPAPMEKSKEAGESVDDDYAATGMGRRVDNPVRRVHLRLEKDPSAKVRIRYEYRPQLVALGVLPPPPLPHPLDRREQARGFTSYCPVPPAMK
jgi:hypothetical protein